MDAEARLDFTAFVASRSQSLFRTALALTGNRHQAEDLLQTVLAKSVRHWERIRHGQPEAYLRTALYRQHTSLWRRRMRGQELPTERVPDVPRADETARVDLTLALVAALRRLAPKHRAVLALRYLEDRPVEEIAEILDCTPGTVRSQTTRALRRLRQLCPELDDLAVEETWR